MPTSSDSSEGARRPSPTSVCSAAKHSSGDQEPILAKVEDGRRWWRFRMRTYDDNGQQDWWFAGTAIPLLAATLGPLANVLSIAALVSSWRECLVDPTVNDPARGYDPSVNPALCPYDGVSTLLPDLGGQPFDDPRWCYWLNVVSLILGFVGNLFLLLNFTNRIRYIVALPMTIGLWYLATCILIVITSCMNSYVAPIRPYQTYTQGFWYGVIASVLYLVCSMLLMVNMLGYFLGHYPQQFALTDHQRTLILQTMLFFIWLAGGGAVFSRVEQLHGATPWSFTDGLYFCDVTILTVGFGDLYPTNPIGRGLVFPYSVGGIIMLGLMISSLTKFAKELGSDNVVKKHIEKSRTRTIGRTVTSSMELRRRVEEHRPLEGAQPTISGPFDGVVSTTTVTIEEPAQGQWLRRAPTNAMASIRRVGSFAVSQASRGPRIARPKVILLREEKDRFDAMRRIQRGTAKFKRWYALTLSVIAFGVLWCVGAVVFWRAEQRSQQMTYFEALYFCYVSLLTIGYGDLAPKSNAGRPFFVVWSLIAVPTMTILISDMGDTVISNFKQGTFKLADFTVLPKAGIWREGLEKVPWLLSWLQKKSQARAAQKRLEEGFPVGPEEEDDMPIRSPTIEALADEVSDTKQNVQDLARKLALSIRRTANDLKRERPKRYSYAEWVEFTRLIRFTSKNLGEKIVDDDEEGLIEWDWIGENSPMMATQSESEFVLDRLCESMARYIRWQEMVDKTVDEGKAAHLELDEKKGADLKMASEKEVQLTSALVRDEARLLEELEALQKQNEELRAQLEAQHSAQPSQQRDTGSRAMTKTPPDD
ncbi:hypothetical protein B0A49_08400 [Cryomyces minteri]|uniref:Potassium channel domain-containing protein n=2 Tax=Cryomyces minteri TaxID=331657 RepID=A0A4U0WGH8_9PEZI|nr:hypothetical protein B0A49_08400 [Cryomyces minteri]